ncbi:MAG: TrmH family RNA methyltransferase [Bacteroidetes bacterium]|nr:MAG: TrmH family RNA methyltransferase [Bacteroidota bacterium]
MKKELLQYLSAVVNPERLSLFNRIIENRTNYITVVLEDIFQPQNASAVLRSCDCLGIQNVHVIENRNEFQVDTEVTMGSSKWLTINRHSNNKNNSAEAIQHLKKMGYRIVATSPHSNDVDLPNFDIEKGKIALVFGSELPGISKVIMQEADEFLKIPMYGFTESYNISVSAAIILFHLTEKMRNSQTIDWQLSEDEKVDIKLQWIRNSVKKSKLIENRFWEERGMIDQ